LKLRPWGLLTAAGSLSVVGTFAGFFGRFAWWLDLASHFRAQYFILLTVISACYFLGRRWRLAGGAVLVAIINLALIAPLYLPRKDTSEVSGKSCRAMLINVNMQLGNVEAVLNAIREYSPDIIVLVEINDKWIKDLGPVIDNFQHRIVRTRNDNFGIALFSRHAWKKSEIVFVGEIGVPSVYAIIILENVTITVIGTHPLPPGGAKYSAYRNDQLERLSTFIRQFDTPILLLGDLNVSPWSYYFRKLLKDANLKDASQGYGIQPTWPAMAWPFLIPIDHCLHSEDLRILRKKIGKNLGSDHYPVIVDFALK